MQDLAVEEIGHGGETDMRMRAHIETGASAQRDRTHLIEKYEWAHRAALSRRKNAANLEPFAEVAGPWHDNHLEYRAHRLLPCSGPTSKYSKMAR
jgi:hypothetical protein